MSTTATDTAVSAAVQSLAERYRAVRAGTVQLCEPLTPEDCQVQSMTEASPVKWHLAHTTWFFETFLLKPHRPGHADFHPDFDYLFNSYYYTVGQMHARPRRGLVTRPSLDEVYAYRDRVDEAVEDLLAIRGGEPEILSLLELGLNHEQQHQELILTDIKHAFWCNPVHPAYRDSPLAEASTVPLEFVGFAGGRVAVGHAGDGFAFDNETPRHEVLLQPFALANRLVTNGEYLEFIRDGGYREAALWLSDAWTMIVERGLEKPQYWSEGLDTEFTLHGEQPLDPNAPVCHVSHYEADAYARWAGSRLPTEFEWESVAAQYCVDGHFAGGARLHPRGPTGGGIMDLFGNAWEWTASAYLGYPGYRPPAGSVGEYNGKFMSGQMVIRGGSCATPPGHVRASYRNFFPPDACWQFTGIRLARDA